MSDLFTGDYKAALRRLLETGSAVVQLERGGDYDEWRTVWDDYSTYGWRDYDAADHIRGEFRQVKVPGWEELPSYRQTTMEHVEGTGCRLVIPEGVEVREVNYSQFQDTVADNLEVVGVNGWGGDKDSPTNIHCECGEHSGLMIRWEGTLMDAVKAILEIQERSLTL